MMGRKFLKQVNWQYLPAFFPSVLVITGNLQGGFLTMMNGVFTLILLVVIDFFMSENRNPNQEADSIFSSIWLVLASLIHWICLCSLIWGILTHRITGGWIWAAAISTGLNAGLLGLNTAHELIHRRGSLLRSLGILNLMSCCYGHFYIEHRLGHHVRVGLPEDPATARKGEGFYRFLIRTIPGQWLSAFRLDQIKVEKGKTMLNFVFMTSLAELMVVFFLFYLKTEVGFAFLGSTAMAVFLLEYVNYIEHYGLIREEGERPGPAHAWQSDTVTSRFHLFELSRHSHHHMDAKIPYPALQSLESAKRLPFGYFGMFYIALVPPLWFKVMDKRI